MADNHHRRWRLAEYAAVVLATVATASVVLVANRADRQGAHPAPTATASPTTAVTPTATAHPGPPAASVTSTTTPAPPAPSTTTQRTTAAPAPVPVPVGLFGRDVEMLPTSRKIVALTFDAGASADGLNSIMATLHREGVAATFFLTGRFAGQFPGQSAAIVAAGHRLGNHSVSHPHFPALSDQAIRAELAGAEQAIRTTTGRSPRPLFRFPYGDRDQRTIQTVNNAGYVPVRWTVDSLGWKGSLGGMTAAAVTSRVLGALRPGEIVLMHVGSHPEDHTTLDADALPSVIAQIRAAGYGFVTLDALLD